jgi:hypothetical protein
MNASKNVAILAVDASIGFAGFRLHGTYQIWRDALGAWIGLRVPQ